MFYTVTFNPSLDYYLKVNTLKFGAVNRAATERFTVGGKGVNVSLELKQLGDDTAALGFIAGFTGEAIKDEIKKTGLKHQLIQVDGTSRINVKIKSVAETDVNGVGANITSSDERKLTEYLKSNLKKGDWVIICGSAVSEEKEFAYARLIDELRGIEDVKIVVDACGKLLTETLRYRPFLIKPNLFELCEIFGLPVVTYDTKVIAEYARKLQSQGARNVIVSLGADGAVMVTETQQNMYVRAARGQLVNSVGAGDCMIAGFIHEFVKTGSYFKALNFATAAGSACAFTEGLATKEQIEYVESLML